MSRGNRNNEEEESTNRAHARLETDISRLVADILKRKESAGRSTVNEDVSIADPSEVERFVAQIKTEGADKFDVTAPWHRSPDTYSASGTAWFVRPPHQPDDEPTSFLVTCAHCIADAVKEGVTITVPAYSKYAARKNKRSAINVDVVAVFPDDDVDAALLHIRDIDALFDKDEKEHEKVHFLAYPLGDDTTLKSMDKLTIYGHPLGTESIKAITVHFNGRDDGSNIQMDGAINEGHSGAAVLSADKRVVAHVTSGHNFANNVSYGTPVGMLTPLLNAVKLPKQGERASKTQIVEQGNLGVSFYNSNLAMNNFLKTECQGGELVEFVMSTSPLRGKVQPNDLLCAIRRHSDIEDGDSRDGKKPAWHNITNEGKVEVEWAGSTDTITLRELVQRWPHQTSVDLRFFDSTTHQGKVLENEKLDYVHKHGMKPLYYPWEMPDYEVVAGIVVMPLSRKLRRHVPYTRPEDMDQPAVIVTNILKPSDVARQKVPLTGKLDKVNGRTVRTMAEFRDAFVHPENGHLTFENEMHHRVVVPVKTFVEKERELAENKRYPLSPLYDKLHSK